jgi:ribosomal protein S18 acetylase RimI-like enzyme
VRASWFDDRHREGIVLLVQSVAATGGAVGWLEVPEPDEVHAWADGVVRAGGRLAVVEDAGRVLACGLWERLEPQVLSGIAHVRKVMTHPDARGRGAGRVVVRALVDDAREQGIELVTLDCRGNNHGAQRLYASLGFVVTGRRPDAIRIGDERFDQVLMHLDLRCGTAGLVRHGSRHEGLGVT